MSAIPAPFSPDPRVSPESQEERNWLRPGWLRPAALAAGLSLNLAAALLIGRTRVETPQILPSIDVSLVPAPYVPPPPASPEVVAPEKAAPPEPAPLASPEPEVTPPAAAEPPVAIVPPAPPPPAVDPAIERRKAEEAEKRRQERALELHEAKKRQELEARQTQMRLEARREAQEKAQEKAKQAAKARQAERGAQAQRQNVSGESRAAYGGVVVAEIQRRRPIGAARAGGATGQVGVTFTVGSSGRIVSHRLDSSPDPRLAAAVGAIMAAVHAPPPPGGSFTAHTSLNFSAR